jgi:predicted aspartyl protease
MRVGDKMYKVREALIDTGTSLLIFPEKLYEKINQQFLNQYCA